MLLALVACQPKTDTVREGPGHAYVAQSALPQRLALAAPVVAEGVDLDPEVAGLIRGVLGNYLVGKGFLLADAGAVARCAGEDPAALLGCLEGAGIAADGVVRVRVLDYAAVNVGFVERFVLEAEASLHGPGGEALGTWRDRASRRKLSIATDPLSAVLILASSAVAAQGDVHRRNVVYDWAFNVSALMPSLTAGASAPQVQRVVTNVGEESFKRGDQVAVGFEGDRGLDARFDIGDFRRDIPLMEKEPGVYVGTYVVREGDQADAQPITLHLAAATGARRDWPVTGPLVRVDGVPPPAPLKLDSRLTDSGVRLAWQTRDAQVEGFVVRRSDQPLAGYQDLGTAAAFAFDDPDVSPGGTYYYQVVALDGAGNASEPALSGAVVLPVSGEPELAGEVHGRLAPGRYRLNGEVRVPPGRELELPSGVTLLAGEGAGLAVHGTLTAQDAVFRPAAEGGRWAGVRVLEGGLAKLVRPRFRGCEVCLDLAGGALGAAEGRWRDAGVGVRVATSRHASLEGGDLRGLTTAIEVLDGSLSVSQATVTENETGIVVRGGSLALGESNLYGNRVDLTTVVPLTLAGNYLGGGGPNRAGLDGPITVRSVLDAPWPGGEPRELDPEALAQEARVLREEGIAAFQKRRFGDAYERLQASLALHEDRMARLYLAYVLDSLGEGEALEALLERAVERHPYEVRFYNLGVRHLMAQGRRQEAAELLERALVLNPGDASLEALRQLVAE
jgi:hypothetical protein